MISATESRAAHYASRPRAEGLAPRRQGPAPIPAQTPDSWPVGWALLYPALLRAPIRESSRRRVIASATRCAEALASTDAEPDWSRYTALSMTEALKADGCRPQTIATYLDGLVMLGRHGGVRDVDLAGLREMRDQAKAAAAQTPKLKVARLLALEERGGFAFVVETIARLREEADALPSSSAAAERLRQTMAILAIEFHAWARTGDIASWRLGEEIVREPSGVWRLTWTAEKNDRLQDLGDVPMELGAVLDDHLLGGRPRRLAPMRYIELRGKNWLTLSDRPMPARQPSQLIREAISVPAHDLRTAIADLMRRVDPAEAARVIAGVLGHRDLRTGEAYRALCADDAAAREWMRMRAEIGGAGEVEAA